MLNNCSRASGILSQPSRNKRAESNLLADEKGPQQVVVWLYFYTINLSSVRLSAILDFLQRSYYIINLVCPSVSYARKDFVLFLAMLLYNSRGLSVCLLRYLGLCTFSLLRSHSTVYFVCPSVSYARKDFVLFLQQSYSIIHFVCPSVSYAIWDFVLFLANLHYDLLGLPVCQLRYWGFYTFLKRSYPIIHFVCP